MKTPHCYFKCAFISPVIEYQYWSYYLEIDIFVHVFLLLPIKNHFFPELHSTHSFFLPSFPDIRRVVSGPPCRNFEIILKIARVNCISTSCYRESYSPWTAFYSSKGQETLVGFFSWTLCRMFFRKFWRFNIILLFFHSDKAGIISTLILVYLPITH